MSTEIRETATEAKPKRVPVVVEEYTDEQTGHIMRRYETGVVYDMTLKRMHKSPDPEYRGIQSSEQAREMRIKHLEATRNEIYKAIVGKSIERGFNYVTTPSQAAGAMVGELWDLALDKRTKPRDRREIAMDIMRGARLIADARTRDDDDDPGPQTLDIGALERVVASVERLMAAKRALDEMKKAPGNG